MSSLYRVIYCSRNRLPGTPQEVSDAIAGILARSRRNNARDYVTGGLLFSDGCFAQVLEGPRAAVLAAFERIQCDERHGEVTVLQAGPIGARHFSDWSMGFAGTPASHPRIDGLRLPEALSDPHAGGQDVIAMLHAVVVRETEWLEAV